MRKLRQRECIGIDEREAKEVRELREEREREEREQEEEPQAEAAAPKKKNRSGSRK